MLDLSRHPQCQAGNVDVCVPLVIQEMKVRLKQLGCDHDAIFALTYYLTTKVFLETVDTLPYQDLASVVCEDALFADYYFRAFDAFHGGNLDLVPPAWQIAFQAAAAQSVFSAGNAFLGISAHINNDLPLVLYDLHKQGSPVSKVDHYLVNEFLAQVVVDTAIQKTYDSDYPTSPPPDPSQPNIIELWRAGAWLNYQ